MRTFQEVETMLAKVEDEIAEYDGAVDELEVLRDVLVWVINPLTPDNRVTGWIDS